MYFGHVSSFKYFSQIKPKELRGLDKKNMFGGETLNKYSEKLLPKYLKSIR